MAEENMTTVSEAMEVTVNEMKGKLDTLVGAFREGEISQEDIPTPIMWGPPGIGKTSITRQITAEHDIDFQTLVLTTHHEADLCGIPDVDEDGVVRWGRPELIPKDGEGILLVDDFTLARGSKQEPATQLVEEKRVEDHELGDGGSSVWRPTVSPIRRVRTR